MQNLNKKLYRNVHDSLYYHHRCREDRSLAFNWPGAALSAHWLSRAPGFRTPVAPFQTAQQQLRGQAKLDAISLCHGDWRHLLKPVYNMALTPRLLVVNAEKRCICRLSKRGQKVFQAPLLVSLSIISHEDLSETLDNPIFSLGGGLGGRRAGAWSGGSGGAGG